MLTDLIHKKNSLHSYLQVLDTGEYQHSDQAVLCMSVSVRLATFVRDK
jgi:hypothetical protein